MIFYLKYNVKDAHFLHICSSVMSDSARLVLSHCRLKHNYKLEYYNDHCVVKAIFNMGFLGI